MLGHFSEEAIEAFIQMSCDDKGLDYSETFDFARCQRPDGSFYGTRGMCKPPAKATKNLPKGRNVGERNRNARAQKSINKIADRLSGKSKSASSGQKLDGKSAADALAAKKKLQDTWDKGGSKKSTSGGGGGGLSPAQLAAIWAKSGGGKGKGLKGGFGRR
jgi:hypothetical protein